MDETWFKLFAQFGVPTLLLGLILVAAGKWGNRILDAHLAGYKVLTEGLIRVVERIDASDTTIEQRFAGLRSELLAAIEASGKETRHAAAAGNQVSVGWILRAIDARTNEEYHKMTEARTRATDSQ